MYSESGREKTEARGRGRERKKKRDRQRKKEGEREREKKKTRDRERGREKGIARAGGSRPLRLARWSKGGSFVEQWEVGVQGYLVH